MDTGYQAHKHCWLSMWAELAPVSAHGAGGGGEEAGPTGLAGEAPGDGGHRQCGPQGRPPHCLLLPLSAT